MLKYMMLLVIVFFLNGCSLYNDSDPRTSYASSAGDQQTHKFDEIIISVPAGNNNSLSNLHVHFSAIINETKNTRFLRPAIFNDMRSLVRRMQTRIKHESIQTISKNPLKDIANSNELINLLIKNSQQVFDTNFNKWKYADNYKIEIVITDFYLTDTSIPPTPTSRRIIW